jgi:nitrite reductase/ring-hydroxylating ferredoxin subunit
MAEWFVAKTSELKEGDRRIVSAGKREIGVFHKAGAYYAYSNTCLHQGGPACEGMMINNVVDVIDKDRLYHGQDYGDEVHFVCPWHGYEYDLMTGECIGDRKLKLRKYEIVKRGEDIYVVA